MEIILTMLAFIPRQSDRRDSFLWLGLCRTDCTTQFLLHWLFLYFAFKVAWSSNNVFSKYLLNIGSKFNCCWQFIWRHWVSWEPGATTPWCLRVQRQANYTQPSCIVASSTTGVASMNSYLDIGVDHNYESLMIMLNCRNICMDLHFLSFSFKILESNVWRAGAVCRCLM